MKYYQILLVVFSLTGCHAPKPRSFVHKETILEPRVDSESNIQSHEIADIYQRLDKIEAIVNKSLRNYEKPCFIESRIENDDNKDVTIVKTRGATHKLGKDLVRLRQAFSKEKIIFAELRNTFPIFTKEVDRIQHLTSDLQNENADLTKTMNILKEEIVQHQMKFDKIAGNMERIKSDFDTYKSQSTRMFNDLDSSVRTFSSCVDAINNEYTQSGIYSLRLNSTKTTLKVYCDQVTDGGGWMVFQRRIDGTEDFYRGWEEYKEGFGNLQAEFWLGNEYLSAISASGQHELRIDMEDFDGTKAFAQYKSFKIDDESQNYKLEVSGYHGNASDSLIKTHSGRRFSTKDRDNDISDKSNCAVLYTGAWWYNKCHASNLNGKYYKLGRCPAGKGISWYYLKTSKTDCLKFVEMKLR